MRFSTLVYTLKQGIINIFRNKWYSLASVATISACLFLFGVFYSIAMNFQHIIKEAEKGVAVTVFFDEDVSEERVAEVGALIEARTEVDHTHFVSDEEAWESFRDDYLGEYAAEGFPDNPLEGSFNYQVYINDTSMQPALVSYLESLEGVREVVRSELTANVFENIDRLVGYVTIGIIAILLCVSVFLIANTVTIGISVRKEEINIMKYIGATDFFVRFPFVIEGVLIGACGSLIPLGVVYMIYNNVIQYLVEQFTVLSSILQLLSVQEVFRTLIPVSICIGVGIGFIGSFTTVRKHIHV